MCYIGRTSRTGYTSFSTIRNSILLSVNGGLLMTITYNALMFTSG